MVSHRNERGAAVFIVVMVMTLLTALGIFAVRSASFWSSSICWFWTSCAAATASVWSFSTWRSSTAA